MSALDADRRVGDDESEAEQWKRNFQELLQELRVAQTGVQILFAFLLILGFSTGFDATDPFTRTVYMVALLAAAGATALIIGPVPYHRMLFRQRRKPVVVRHSHWMALGGLLLLMVAMVSTVLLATDEVLGRSAAALISVLTGIWYVLLWLVLPVAQRLRDAGADDEREEPVG